MDMVKRINRQSLILLVITALLAALFDYRRAPLSVLVGGAIALANLKALEWGITALINPEAAGGAKGKLMFFSMLRLLAVFVILAVLIYYKLVNIIAVLAGLTVVFLLIVKEGLREARGL